MLMENGGWRCRKMKSASIFFILIALLVGMVGCSDTPTQYTLSVSSTSGGTVTHPGIGTFTYPAGAVVLLEVEPEEGYGFTHWSGNVSTIEDVNALTTTITMNGHYFITANFAYGNFIQTWYDLDGIRDDLGGYYVLMNDLDSATPGYSELASDVANQGKGWQPIAVSSNNETFVGTFDGQGYEIKDLFINRLSEGEVGLFGYIGEGGIVKNVGLVNADVTGGRAVGALVGASYRATVSNCYATGSIIGVETLGGMVGTGMASTVRDSYCTCSVRRTLEFGGFAIGGLVGENVGVGNSEGTISNCYATGSISGERHVGGLVGIMNRDSIISDSYFTGSVTGNEYVGGLVGGNEYVPAISNSYYNYDEVLINGDNVITVGALFDEDFAEWLANGKFLDVNEKLSNQGGYYLVNNITDFQQLLGFGQNAYLKFRLINDLDLAGQPNFYIPYLAGEFDGGGHEISNLSFDVDCVESVGLFGYLAHSGEVRELGVVNINITGVQNVGGLVGLSEGTVSNSYSTGSVTGWNSYVGGLIGYNFCGTVSSSYSTSSVTGEGEYSWALGGLLGAHYGGTVSDSYAAGNVTGKDHVGGLVGGNGGNMSDCYATGSVAGSEDVGGLVGWNTGPVSSCYSTGEVAGQEVVGGLVGLNGDNVSDSYSTGNVTGSSGVGGLVGQNWGVVNSSFWDTQTSGQASSDGGAGKTTAEMQDISTFSGAAWEIVTVANSSTRNLAYIWNIVDDVTYPFLSWQPVS
jgi:hypothetical protein